MYRWSSLATVALLLGTAVACTDFNLDGDGNDTGETPEDTADTADTGSGTEDSAEPPALPSWIAVEGTIVVVASEANPTASTLSIEYRLDPTAEADPSGDSGADGAASLPCARTPVITALAAESAPDPAVTMGWWAVTFDPSPDAACSWSLPENLHLGFGTLDTQLYAAMDLAGLPTTGSALYGLYVRLGAETSPVWVYGVVGTAGQYDNAVVAPSAPPLPDGTYTLTALHLLPYTPAR